MTQMFPKAEPHGALQPIFEDAWFLTGSIQMAPLLRIARNMVVLRHGGELSLINSVRLDEAGESALLALGKVAHVLKIGLHGRDDAYYLERFSAKVWCLPDQLGHPDLAQRDPDAGLGAGSEQRSPKLLTKECRLPIPGARLFLFEATQRQEAAILLEKEGGLLVTCDSLQPYAPSELISPLGRLASRLMGFEYPLQIGRPWRKRQTPKGGSLRGDFERLEALPFQRIIGGHGGLLQDQVKGHLRAAIERELGKA